MYIHNNEQFPGPHAGRGFDIAGVETFSSGSETTDWSFQVCHLAGNTFCVIATTAANEGVFIIDDHVVNSRKANLKEFFSERQTLFSTVL